MTTTDAVNEGRRRAKEFDVGTPVFGRGLTARELRRGLGMGS